jgi:hypothetical protein
MLVAEHGGETMLPVDGPTTVWYVATTAKDFPMFIRDISELAF